VDRRPGWAPARYALAVLIAVVATVLKVWLDRYLEPPYILAFPAVMAAAAIGGMGPGLLATGVTALGAWYWTLPLQPAGGTLTWQDLLGWRA
jgi:uncharacterized membrane protein